MGVDKFPGRVITTRFQSQQQKDALDAAVRAAGCSLNAFVLLSVRHFIVDLARGGNLIRQAAGTKVAEWPRCQGAYDQLPIEWIDEVEPARVDVGRQLAAQAAAGP